MTAQMRVFFRVFLTVCVLCWMGCGGGDDDPQGPAVGTVGGECYPNSTCDAGLECAQGYCVPEAPVPDTSPPEDTKPPEPVCGDGTTEAGEACDDGNTETETACTYGTPSCDACNADCSATLTLAGAYCGDGTVDADNETCDDGNTTDGDGCSSTCTTESCDTFTFESMQSGTTANLGGVWGTSGSNVYAVGKDGIIIHYDGQSWTPMTSNTSSTLTSIWGVGPDDIYAVGQNDLLHFDGTSWTSQGGGVPVATIDVWGVDKDDVYLVGWQWTIHKGSLDTWTSVNIGIPSPGTEANQIIGIHGFGSESIYAVGVGGSILQYNGISWSKAQSGTSEHLASVWGTGTNDVFVGGEGGTLLHYDGSSWSPMPSNVVGTVQGLYGISATNAYAVGDPDSYTEGFIAHYDGTSWSDVTAPGASRLEDIWITPDGSEAFAVGYDGSIMHGFCP